MRNHTQRRRVSAGVSSALTNNGTITLQSASLILNSAGTPTTFTLTGAGTVSMSGNAKNQITGKSGQESLINDVNQTIEGSGTIGNLASFTNNGTLSSQGAHPLIVSATLTNWDGTGLNGGTYIVNQNLQLNSLGSRRIGALQQGASISIDGPGILTGDGHTNALAALNAVTDSSLALNVNASIAPSSGTSHRFDLRNSSGPDHLVAQSDRWQHHGGRIAGEQFGQR